MQIGSDHWVAGMFVYFKGHTKACRVVEQGTDGVLLSKAEIFFIKSLIIVIDLGFRLSKLAKF